MVFERIFEAKTSRIVMVGLFLALLELIRDRLVWVEQPKSSTQLYLRALTDEPAEQAVQKAILAASGEMNNQQSSQTQKQRDLSIPIAELPTKRKTDAAPDKYNKEQAESTQGHKEQTAN